MPRTRRSATTKPAPSLRARALDYLARREYSRQELEQKLRGFATDDDDLPALLTEFEQRGWLSATRFVEQIVHARQARYGSQRIAHELRQHGIDDALVAQALDTVKDDELANARAVWQKKFAEPPRNRESWAKQARFLQGRGFGFDIIKQVLNSHPDDTD